MIRQTPFRGEVWMVNFDPSVGHEQGGERPALVVSSNNLNAGPAGIVTVVPMTSREKGIPSHVPVEPPEAGLKRRSFVKCEDIRTISKLRLSRRYGAVSDGTMKEVERRLRIILEL